MGLCLLALAKARQVEHAHTKQIYMYYDSNPKIDLGRPAATMDHLVMLHGSKATCLATY